MNLCHVCGGVGPDDFGAHIEHVDGCRIGLRLQRLTDLANPVGVPGMFANMPTSFTPRAAGRRSVGLDRLTL